MKIVIFIVIAVVLCAFAYLVTMAPKKRYPLSFRVKRGPTEAYEPIGLTQVTDYLSAHGFLAGSPEWEAALAGKPFVVDGTTMQFRPVKFRQ